MGKISDISHYGGVRNDNYRFSQVGKEAGDVDAIIRAAIREKRLLRFTYHDLDRIAEPHVYGIHKGKSQLLVFQIRGQSSSGGLPNWRRIDLDEVTNMQALDETFPGPRPTPSGEHSKFDTVLAVVQ